MIKDTNTPLPDSDDEYDYDIEYVPAYWTSCGKHQEQYDQLLTKLETRSGTVASADDILFEAAAEAYDQHFMHGKDMETFRDEYESMLQRLSTADNDFLSVHFNRPDRPEFDPEQDYEWDWMLDSVLERLIARRKGRTSGYVLFCNAHRQQVKNEYPNLQFTEIGRELGQMWGKTGDQEKETRNAKAAEQNENGLPDPGAKEALETNVQKAVDKFEKLQDQS
jgi:hypothetical protein